MKQTKTRRVNYSERHGWVDWVLLILLAIFVIYKSNQ